MGVRFRLAAASAVAVIAAVQAASNPAKAQSASEPVVLPEVSVSATGIATPLSQIASSVTVITAEEIARTQRRTLPDVLNNVPGLNVVQTGGPGGQTAIFMRGTNSNHVKVLLDGIDMGDVSAPNGAVDLAHIATGDIERIEVLRGPQGGLYGANAIGGVISIVTKKGEGPAKATATLEGGALGTFNQSAAVSGAKDRFDYAFSVAHLRSSHVDVTPTYVLPAGQSANPNSYDNMTYSTRLGAKITDDLRVNLIGRYVDIRLKYSNDDPSTFPSAPYATRSDYGNKAFFGRAEAVYAALNGRFINTVGVNVADNSRTNKDPNANPATTNDGTRTAVNWRGEIAVAKGHTLLLGAERSEERANTQTYGMFGGAPLSYSAKNGNTAGYAEMQSQFAERFFIVGNIRVDDDDKFGSHTTWRVAPAFIMPGSETKLKGSYGTAFKAPTLYELYGVGDFNYVGNPNLKPETSKGWEVGFEQPLFGDRLRFGVTYFRNDIKDLINNVFAPVNTYVNVGKAKTEGYEAFVDVKATDRLRFHADYTRTDATNVIANTELLRRPKHKANFSASYQATEALGLSASVLYVGPWMDFDRQGLWTTARDFQGYTVVNIAANYAVNKQVTVFGRVDNLFDKRYEVPVGWKAPGVGVFGGIKVSTL
ncbi:TonB-dependent receptor plug domain-containing protein [Undibacter mobilis]|nr:TonB-dependent receptor [Undibacter mobilis]